jgi:hypothetical protein
MRYKAVRTHLCNPDTRQEQYIEAAHCPKSKKQLPLAFVVFLTIFSQKLLSLVQLTMISCDE